MKQAVIEGGFGLDRVVWREVEAAAPGPGQVLVGVRAVSLNYRDLLVVKGRYNPKMPLPRVPLSDGAGQVLAVGEGVTRWKAGDRVAGIFMQTWLSGAYEEGHGKSALGGAVDGMLSEEVVLGAEGLVEIPAHLSYREGAALPCAAVTAWHALFERRRLGPGQTVLVQGSGGVSVFALQLARMAGARVIATSRSEAKRERLRALGADWVIDYEAVPEWGKLVGKAGGVDHVVEVGGVRTLEQSLAAVRPGGQVSVIGVLTGLAGEVNLAPVLHKNLHLEGIYVGSRAMFESLNRAVTQAHRHPVIDATFAAEDIRTALGFMESAAHFGKIVLEIR
ncbi:MAG: zinc-dependent alcohol dehydrogenase family protein [Acidobacteriota bacterium]